MVDGGGDLVDEGSPSDEGVQGGPALTVAGLGRQELADQRPLLSPGDQARAAPGTAQDVEGQAPSCGYREGQEALLQVGKDGPGEALGGGSVAAEHQETVGPELGGQAQVPVDEGRGLSRARPAADPEQPSPMGDDLSLRDRELYRIEFLRHGPDGTHRV